MWLLHWLVQHLCIHKNLKTRAVGGVPVSSHRFLPCRQGGEVKDWEGIQLPLPWLCSRKCRHHHQEEFQVCAVSLAPLPPWPPLPHCWPKRKSEAKVSPYHAALPWPHSTTGGQLLALSSLCNAKPCAVIGPNSNGALGKSDDSYGGLFHKGLNNNVSARVG